VKQLIDYLENNKIPYNEETIKKFEGYRSRILELNEHINLTAIKDPDEFTLKHFVDSVTCYNIPEYQDGDKILDLGTGAGFPGVPLAILSPEKEFVLVDSLNKRLKIIMKLCDELGIENVTTVHGRAEDLARQEVHREKYDVCISRAVANLNVLSEYCLPFVKNGGYMAAYKGADAEKEVEDAKKAMKILGAVDYRLHDASIGESGRNHQILLVKKGNKTPSKYPRKAGTPVKEPLK